MMRKALTRVTHRAGSILGRALRDTRPGTSLALRVGAGGTPNRFQRSFIRSVTLGARPIVIRKYHPGLEAKVSLDITEKTQQAIALTDSYEPWVARQIRAHARAGSVVLDIGAHVGYFSLLLSNIVGSEGRVLAFEPNPDNRIRLEENLRLNFVTNVDVITEAVSAQPGTSILFLNPFNEGGGTMTKAFEEFPDGDLLWSRSAAAKAFPEKALEVEVGTTTVDDITAALSDRVVSLMKVDVEEAELEVFKGALETLRTARPVVIAETRENSEAVRFLTEVGYREDGSDESGNRLFLPR